MANRRFILAEMIKGFTSGIELGALRGDTTFYLLKRFPDLKLTVVDKWQNYPEYDDVANNLNLEAIYKEFYQKAIKFRDRLTIMRTSTEEAIIDKKVDFVFIDANHSYEYCKRDIELYRDKVKAGGILCGHDIDVSGVKKAVQEIGEKIETVGNIWKCRL